MYVRVKRSVQSSGTYEYLQIVESVREGSSVRQHVIANLGRRDQLVSQGGLDGLLESLAKFSERLRVVEKVRTEGILAHTTRIWGTPLVFERLWQTQGMDKHIQNLVKNRNFLFDMERTVFALALQRLMAPGSDLQGASWVHTVECNGFSSIELQHMYRAVNFLADERSSLEKSMFMKDRDLFSQALDLVFIDTTSTYIHGFEPTEMRKRGYSRDKRPDCLQVIICLAVDSNGWPIAWEILPGNTADKTAFVSMIAKLRERFHIRNIVVVADRGMISKNTITLLENDTQAPFDYILGCKMRAQKEVNEEVLARAGRYHKVDENLEVKEVLVDGRRYIICKNPIEEEKDALARKAIIEKLTKHIEQGPKSLMSNVGFKRFLRVQKGAMSIDTSAIENDARLDGKFVLRTSTKLSPTEVAKAYKSLWRVERAFRETKQTLEVRPLFHQNDHSIIGHIMACFMALRLEVDLQQRLDDKNIVASWPDIMRDLGQVKAVDITLDGCKYLLRTELSGHAHAAFMAAGVRPPRLVKQVNESDTCSA